MEEESDIDAELAAQQAESEAASKAFDAELATLNAELAQREAALVVAYTQRSKSALKNGTAVALLADSEVALMYHVPKLHRKLLKQVRYCRHHLCHHPAAARVHMHHPRSCRATARAHPCCRLAAVHASCPRDHRLCAGRSEGCGQGAVGGAQ